MAVIEQCADGLSCLLAAVLLYREIADKLSF